MMHDLRIGFSTSDGIGARWIRRLTEAPVNHAFLAYASEDWGGRWVAQADHLGVRLVPFHVGLAAATEVELYECAADLRAGLYAVRGYVGARYDWRGVITGLACLAAWRLTGRRFLYPTHSMARMFCSEFVATILQGARVPGTEPWVPARISPGDLRWFVRSSNLFREVTSGP
jgi:hypothetical protein